MSLKKIKSTDPENQGPFVLIEAEDFDPERHEEYTEGDEAPAKPAKPAKQPKAQG